MSQTIQPHWRETVADEAEELNALSQSLAALSAPFAQRIAPVEAAFARALHATGHPVEGERLAEQFTRALRRAWLETAATAAAAVYRSPNEADEIRLEHGPHTVFGYERDLSPDALETRCAAYLGAPPAPWRAHHLVFSSGQAAMTAALLAIGGVLGRPPSIMHGGGYFETRALIATHPGLGALIEGDVSNADVIVAEGAVCDGAFALTDPVALTQRAQAPLALVLDSTLLSRSDGLRTILRTLVDSPLRFVLRVESGLKLLQAGLELANIGLLSIYERTGVDELADRLRRTRTLTDAGLRYVDLLALDAPWFLDPLYTSHYQCAVFAHNAALAQAVAEENKRFTPVTHPALSGGAAPYCVFQLADAHADYDALAAAISARAKPHLMFEHGGSFGFRGHRYEIVRPETGAAPFLRVAMGRREGWSCDGVIDLMRAVAAGR